MKKPYKPPQSIEEKRAELRKLQDGSNNKRKDELQKQLDYFDYGRM